MKFLPLLLLMAVFEVKARSSESQGNATMARTLATDDFAVITEDLQCVVENEVDYAGNDIGSIQAATVWDCCGLCSEDARCWAYTWTDFNDGTCWLKSARGSARPNSNAKSATLPACREQEQGVDYVGNDIGSVPAARASDCCAACTNRAGCRAYTFTSYQGGTCWLKSAKGRMVVNSGSTSATVYVKTPKCGLENGVDYVGNDIGSVASNSASGCCAICQRFSGCRAYSWTNLNGGTCWLKNRKDAVVQSAGTISGQAEANPPAPSCAMEQNVDYQGADVGSAKSSDAYGCCSICIRAAECYAFSWTNFEGGTCWLKSSRGSTRPAIGVMSAIV